MSFKLFVLAGGMQHPPYDVPTDNLATALQEAHSALGQGYLERTDKSPFSEGMQTTIVKLGPGSLMRLIRDNEADSVHSEQRMRMHRVQQGLIGPAPIAVKPYRVIVQMGANQLDPDLEFDTSSAAEEAVRSALGDEQGILVYTIKEDDDVVLIRPAPGQVFMIMTKEDADTRRRMIIEARMRQAAAQPPSGLIIAKS